MLDTIVDILLVLALLAALLVILYVFLVVRALYTHLKAQGVAPELIPKAKRERWDPVKRAQAFLNRGDTNGNS